MDWLTTGSFLSPYLFNLKVNALIENIKEEVHMSIFFANGIVLLAELREEINTMLETWRNILELKGFHLSRSKS